MRFSFWVSVFLILYTYGGYVVFITLLSLLRQRRIRTAAIEPQVTLIIAAYNEERHIERKLRNSFAMDYPAGRLEIVVGSDASTDQTDEIVRGFALNERGIRVVLHRVEGRLGKTAVQNSCFRVASGEVLVFSDAASMYDSGALRALVRNYADPEVGAASGRYEYLDPKKGTVGFATKLFWRFENFIKTRQTRFGTITGCCGCIYSVRRDLYTELPPEIISDLVEPLTILRKGYRIVFEADALATEEPVERPRDEFKMRVRVIVRGMNGLLYMRSLLNPLRYPFVSFQLVSHKVLRWLVPVFCVIALTSSVWLAKESVFFRAAAGAQMAFYALALTGWLLDRWGIRFKPCYLPLYFTVINAASLVSLYKVFRGQKVVVWQTQR